MAVLNEDGAAAADSDRQRRQCSCLPFCFWRSAGRRPNKTGGAEAKRRRRRRLRLRPSWLAWPPWFRRSGGKGDDGGGDDSSEKGKRRRRGGGGRRLLLLLTTSLQPKKALASVVSGDSSALLPVPVPANKVSSYGDAKKQSNNRRPRRPTVGDDDDDDDDAATSGRRQPQPASATAATATLSTGSPTAAPDARSRPETTTSQAPSPRPIDGLAGGAGRTWRAPSRRQRHSLHQPGDCSGGGGLWTAATTLGVIVLCGRVPAVVFLCSCLYGARFVRAWAAGGGGAGASAKAQLSGGGGGRVDGVSSSGRRFGDPVVGVAAADKQVEEEMCATEECKKKVVMAGLLDRAGRTPSSRFGR